MARQGEERVLGIAAVRGADDGGAAEANKLARGSLTLAGGLTLLRRVRADWSGRL
jgi:hypothetical protein